MGKTTSRRRPATNGGETITLGRPVDRRPAPRVESVDESNRPRSRYGPWRAGTLALVYLLMCVHVAHWLIRGKTMAPLELNEVMYTFELGVVTAGFIFMCTAALVTGVFGRFFCSWGCHILALQDLCVWILGKLRIRPRGIRSRLLLWVPVVVALYMFVWPQAVRVWEGREIARLHLRTDAEGWASLQTENFWRNLPGPGIIALTFGVCGFLIVYVMGSRGFCRYGCPYGVVFGMADRLAPGRIRVGDDCTQCGTCTSVCPSHVRVHEELARYGMVVDPKCLRDLDCVSACPQQSLHYGFGRPSLFRKATGATRVRKQYDFAWWEDLLMVAALVVVLVIYRGLYELVPFFMTVALGVVVGYLVVVLLRLMMRADVKLNRWPLKRDGRMLRPGWATVGVMAAFGLLTVHSGLIRYHLMQGRRYQQSAQSPDADPTHTTRAIAHLALANDWGLFPTDRAERMSIGLQMQAERWQDAQRELERLLTRHGGDGWARLTLATALRKQGRFDDAAEQYRAALAISPERPETHYDLAGFYFETQAPQAAARHLNEAIRLRPNYAEAHYDLGALLIGQDDLTGGIDHLRRAVALKPDFGDAHYNLAVALAMAGSLDHAWAEVQEALRLQPDDTHTLAFRDHLARIR